MHIAVIHRRAIYLILLVLLQVGCATAPVQEMSDARQSIKAAKEVSKGDIANEHLKTAESLLLKAQLALEEGDYGTARENANQARKMAMRVQQQAQDQRDSEIQTR
jgi:putative cell wall-binding protein